MYVHDRAYVHMLAHTRCIRMYMRMNIVTRSPVYRVHSAEPEPLRHDYWRRRASFDRCHLLRQAHHYTALHRDCKVLQQGATAVTTATMPPHRPQPRRHHRQACHHNDHGQHLALHLYHFHRCRRNDLTGRRHPATRDLRTAPVHYIRAAPSRRPVSARNLHIAPCARTCVCTLNVGLVCGHVPAREAGDHSARPCGQRPALRGVGTCSAKVHGE